MKVLDLFCGAGGAALGLRQAGFSTIGVDQDWRCAQHYPGPFLRMDAMAHRWPLDEVVLIWASPPCQRHSCTKHFIWNRPDDLAPCAIETLRERLEATRLPWVIENVPGAPLRPDLVLTGPTVGLPTLLRKRVFELGRWSTRQPELVPMRGSVGEGTLVTVTKAGGIASAPARERRRVNVPHLCPNRHRRHEMVDAMGLPEDCAWTMAQIGEAVPPAYAKWIGERFGQWRTETPATHHASVG